MGAMFDKLFLNISPSKSSMSYFVTLIPKVDSPLNHVGFRPIFLLGPLNKLVGKVWIARLACIMHKIIFSNYLAFIKKRKLVDVVMALNGILELAK